MVTPHLLTVLLAVLLVSALTDLRWQRIPNWITFPSMMGAPLLHTMAHGPQGLLFSLQGIGVGMGLLLVFYVLGGMGAGDVKLLGAVGGFVGPDGVLSAFLMTAVVGGVYAVALLLMHWGARKSMRYGITFLRTVFLTRGAGQMTALREAEPKLRYGVVIAIGTIAAQLWADRLFGS
jgi:prepilin peptidase CpaA